MRTMCRHLASGRWHVKGPQNGVIAEYDSYSEAQYHVVYGHRPESREQAERELKKLIREKKRSM